jgi:hypothetical protein
LSSQIAVVIRPVLNLALCRVRDIDAIPHNPFHSSLIHFS